MKIGTAWVLACLAVGLAAPNRAHGWNFAYARVGKALGEAKKLIREELIRLATRAFGPKAQEVLGALGKLKGRLQNVAADATKVVSEALQQVKDEAVGKLREIGEKVSDEITRGFVGKLLALKDATEGQVRGWLESVRQLRTDALGTLRRAVEGAVDPSKAQGPLEQVLAGLLRKAFGPLASRVMESLEKLAGKARDIAAGAARKVSSAIERIVERATGAVVGVGLSLAERLRTGFLERLESLRNLGDDRLGEWLRGVDALQREALESLEKAVKQGP